MRNLIVLLGLGGAVVCCLLYLWIEHRLIFSKKETGSDTGKKLHGISRALLFGIIAFLILFFGTLLGFF